jgi:hypothetical protein
MPNLNLNFTGWDVLLLAAVSLMGTAVAYLHHPKWKSLILSLPIPFTVANLSLGQGVNVTHVLGLFLLLLYTHGVRLLHLRLGLPIILSIAVSAAGYAATGIWLAGIVPVTETSFWLLSGLLFLLSLALLRFTAHRQEPGHRTPLPVWIKLPIIAGVILLLIIGKKMLQGFMTMFPMVGIVAAYEARHSLWTICRAIPVFSVCTLPMMAVIHVTQPYLGLGGALGAGWIVYLALFIPATLRHWRLNEEQVWND